MSTSHRQSGNVIFIIVIMIVLFAALSFAVNQAMKGNNSSGVNEQKSEIWVTEILAYANSLENAVRSITVNGCLETQLNFYSVSDPSFSTAAAPSDKSCNIFDLNGGGISYVTSDPNWFDGSFSSSTDFGKWLFMGKNCIYGMGSGTFNSCYPTTSELIAYLPFVKQEICVAYNKAMNVNSPTYTPESGLLSALKFSGTYTAGGGALESTAPTLSGKKAGCYKVSSVGNYNNAYTLYYVLLPR